MRLKTKSEEYLSSMCARHPALLSVQGQVRQAAEIICASCKTGGKVLLCGNGGSAADCQHIAGELMKGFLLKREPPRDDVEKLKASGFADWESLAQSLQKGIPAISLAEHSALSTAVINDTDPYITFAQQLYALGRPGDVLIAISTSGNARNVICALKVANTFGISSIGLTGSRPSKMDDLCDTIIKVPETETFKVQELHLPVYHTLCMMVEEELFG